MTALLRYLAEGLRLGLRRFFQLFRLTLYVVVFWIFVASFMVEGVRDALGLLIGNAFPFAADYIDALAPQSRLQIEKRVKAQLDKVEILRGEARRAERRISQAEGELEELRKMARTAPSAKLQTRISAREASISAARSEVTSLLDAADQVARELADLRSRPAGFRADSARASLDVLDARLTQASHRLDLVMARLDGERELRASLRMSIVASTRELAARKALRSTVLARLDGLERVSRALKEKHEILQEEVSRIREKIVRFRSEVSEPLPASSRRRLEAVESKLARLSSELAALPDPPPSVAFRPLDSAPDALQKALQEAEERARKLRALEVKLNGLGATLGQREGEVEAAIRLAHSELRALKRQRALREALPAIRSARRRLFGFLKRDAAAEGVDLIPLVGVFAGTALLAEDIRSTCELNKDLSFLEERIRKAAEDDVDRGSYSPISDEYDFCGMTTKDILSVLIGRQGVIEGCAELREKDPMGDFEACRDIPLPPLPDGEAKAEKMNRGLEVKFPE